MKQGVKYRVLRSASWIMIALVGILLVNKAFFTHSHVLPGGKIVFHAHPFSKSTDDAPLKKHKHTPAQLVYLSNLDLLISQAEPLVIHFVPYFLGILAINTCLTVFSRRVRVKQSRAPPAFSPSLFFF